MAVMHPMARMQPAPLYVRTASPLQHGHQVRPQLQLGQVGSAPAPQIAAAVANLISNASLREEKRPEEPLEETIKPLSQAASDAVYNDSTTGLMGCPLTVPKYSQRLKGSESQSPPPVERRRVSPRQAPQKDFERTWERCHQDLYEDAFARQQRLRDMQHYMKQMEEDDQKTRLQQCQDGMKQRRRYYRGRAVDSSHLEREEENLRRRQEHQARSLKEQRMRELDELRGCTFRPCLVKKLGSSPATPRPPGSPRPIGCLDEVSVSGYSVEYATTKLQTLVEAQQHAYAKLEALAQEEGPLKERLKVLHGELHERIQREETSRVVAMLQDADSGSSSQKDLVQRVRDMVAEGRDPESAQQEIVEELVMQSQDQVRRRVMEHFAPMRLEVEGELYSRQLAVAHELEALEAKAMAIRGGTLCEEAKLMGFDFSLAAQVRQNLRSVPGIRRSNSMGSAYLPRMSSTVSRADTSISSLAEAQSTVLLATANGSKVPGKVDSPRARSVEQTAPPTASAGDSSPIRKLQQGQRVVLPNGMVAFAMPAGESAPASPRRLAQMMTGESPRSLHRDSPRQEARREEPRPQDPSPRRSGALAALQETKEGADTSPRRRVQVASTEVEVFEEAPSVQAPVETLISPRQSMASLASLGSYQAPPSAPMSPMQQSRDGQISKVASSASRPDLVQVPVRTMASESRAAEDPSIVDQSMVIRPVEGPHVLGVARQSLAQSQPQLPAWQAPMQPGSVPTPRPQPVLMQPLPAGSMTLPAQPMHPMPQPMPMPMRPMHPMHPMQAMGYPGLVSPRVAGLRPMIRPM